MICSYFFSYSYSASRYSYSYSIRSNMAIRPQGPQFPREPSRSTIRVAAFQIAIEYEYRPLRRTEYRFAEHEYDEIRCEARKNSVDRVRGGDFTHVNDARSSTSLQCFVRTSSRTRFDLTWRFDPKARNFRANRLGRQSASPHFKQPASTSTVR